MRVEGWWLSG
jgi:hypothetical protein